MNYKIPDIWSRLCVFIEPLKPHRVTWSLNFFSLCRSEQDDFEPVEARNSQQHRRLVSFLFQTEPCGNNTNGACFQEPVIELLIIELRGKLSCKLTSLIRQIRDQYRGIIRRMFSRALNMD